MAVVGWIARTHGIHGQVFVNPETDFPEERFRPGRELFVERDGRIDRLTLTSVRFQQGRPVIAVEGIDSMDQARALAGTELRVPAERLVGLPAGTFYRHDLAGCQVETRTGSVVGVVRDVEGTMHASRLVVSAAQGEILIPLVSEICPVIDAAGKRIVIDPPDGLLELNAGVRT